MKALQISARIAANWASQGFFAMDWTERVFKMIAESMALAAILWISLKMQLPLIPTGIAAILIVHSVSWVVYGERFVALKSLGLTSTSRRSASNYIHGLAVRASEWPYLRCVAITGSFASHKFGARSDIDVRVLRRPGITSGIQACIWAARQRLAATRSHVPLDLLILDSESSFRRKCPDHAVIAIKDEGNFLNDHYAVDVLRQEAE